MEKIKRYIFLIIGCLIVALNYNLLIIPNNLVSFGFTGLSSIIYYINGVNPAINILIFNIITLLISTLIIKNGVNKQFVLSSILVPIFIYLTSSITDYFSVVLPEILLILLVAGVVGGYGYSLIYKYGFQAENSILLEELIGQSTKFRSNIYSLVIDIISLIITFFAFGYELALYSLVVIIIMRFMVTKVRFGLNDSKMFYIITSKEKEVKNYILHDLKYELSVLDVKGGFTKRNNQILFTVISSKDYYQLKEGIKIIDPKAFIAITDTYDVVNRKDF